MSRDDGLDGAVTRPQGFAVARALRTASVAKSSTWIGCSLYSPEPKTPK